jgi:hypothetical protein
MRTVYRGIEWPLLYADALRIATPIRVVLPAGASENPEIYFILHYVCARVNHKSSKSFAKCFCNSIIRHSLLKVTFFGAVFVIVTPYQQLQNYRRARCFAAIP